MKNILVTGGAGFIGSHCIRYILEKTEFQGTVINLDALTYAGNLRNLDDITRKYEGTRYFFVQGDIRNRADIDAVLSHYTIDTVINCAAESHVDRAIREPADFISTNIVGTYTLLEAVRDFWAGNVGGKLFHHVSTDEVYGPLDNEKLSGEESPYLPRNPYAASKASSNHLVQAWYHTYGLPVTLSTCSNNFGPYQFPEKLIPLMITHMIAEKPLPLYGDGTNVRDWLYVEDHASAVWTILHRGETGRSYNICGDNSRENIELVNRLCEIVAEERGKPAGYYKKLIQFVTDRPGHDRRYGIDCIRIKTELGWKPEHSFDTALRNTVRWYLDNREWVKEVKKCRQSSLI